MTNKKTILMGISLGIIIILLLSGVYAKDYVLLCLNEGETVEFSKCNPRIEDRTCGSDLCQYCSFIGTTGAYCPASLSKCNRLGLSCSSLGENATIDKTPPTIILHSPDEGEVYTSRKVLISASANESAKWRYMDLRKGRGWKSLCTNKLTEDCDKKITLKEGLNNISLKATDRANNDGFYNVSFFIDSKKPKIYKTYPKRGFADGNFEVQFKEENPESLILYYGSDEYELNIEENCYEKRGKYYCDTNVDLDSYDGQEIEYYFVLEDIAGNMAESKHYSLDVDTTFPVINNPDSFYDVKGRYVYFKINITEKNFDEVFYVDNNDPRLREKKLCSRLKEGICEKRKRFKRGDYDLTIYVLDEAGHSTGEGISFEIDY
ncbi:hypothetical protein KAJ87_00385 [Candidatus Pacearchaeota archaeon]|nr:hypothetical protein [Candidatus Pacearchaeota archaeon]